MDAPGTSGTESLAPQTVIETGDGVFSQPHQWDAPDSGEDVAVDQVAVSAHCAAAPFALVLGKPAAALLAYGIAVSFLHIVASFGQTNNIIERGK